MPQGSMNPARYACLAIASMTLASMVLTLAAVPQSRAADRPGPAATPAQRGEYVFRLTGGCGCHTDYKNKGAFLAGGRAIKTPFGTVFGTNITPDPETGLGTWT